MLNIFLIYDTEYGQYMPVPIGINETMQLFNKRLPAKAGIAKAGAVKAGAGGGTPALLMLHWGCVHAKIEIPVFQTISSKHVHHKHIKPFRFYKSFGIRSLSGSTAWRQFSLNLPVARAVATPVKAPGAGAGVGGGIAAKASGDIDTATNADRNLAVLRHGLS